MKTVLFISKNDDTNLKAHCTNRPVHLCYNRALVRVAFGTVLCWKTRDVHRNDFAKLSEEAMTLAEETESLEEEVDGDTSTDRAVRTANLALLAEANEWDTSIRICLATWEDLILPAVGTSDEESGKANTIEKGRRKGHGKYMIGTMHARCVEALARRRELGPQLQRIHLPTSAR